MILHLAQRLSQISDIPNGLGMNGVVYTTETESTSGLLYYRFEDEPDADPLFLAEVPAGQSFDFPIDLKGRAIRFFLVSKTKQGALSVKAITEGTQKVFDPGASVIAGEDILTNDLLNYYDDSGTTKARLADATDATKPAQVFAANDALTGELVRPLGAGNLINGLTGKTPGATEYLSTTPGQMSESAPATVGNLVQQIGSAISTTSVDFEPQTGVPVEGSTVAPPSGIILTNVGTFGIHDHVQVDWTNNGGTGSNIIERSLDGAAYVTVGTVAFSASTFTDNGPINGNGSTYIYRVRNASVPGYSEPLDILIP